jgi:glycyl-tRNA synthetase beta chain
MSTLLVEIGTEELPPVALPGMAAALEAGFSAALREARLGFGDVVRFATPRRLALLVRDLDASQADREVERRGPPVKVAFDTQGAATRAALAFAEGCGVAVEALERMSTAKGEWLVHRAREPGRPAAQVVAEVLPAVIDGVPVPRRMRWGSGSEMFSRPVRWLVVMVDEAVVDCTVLGCRSGRRTFGHRFHGPAQGIDLATAAQYPEALASARVIADFDERRAVVLDGIEKTAAQAGARAVVDTALLDEVTALVEWPVPVLASFDEAFLALPREVIVATLQEHQRYFPLTDENGALRNLFVTIANIDSTQPDLVRRGNERVVQPRLADAAFFWEADGRRSLDSRLLDLERVVFQARLGTLADKTRRVEQLVGAWCTAVGEAPADAEHAARLAKTDLLTDMVGEFPELQGVMGRHYALRDGEPEAVAVALEEQYLPRFAGDRLPATSAGRALACADRVDTMVGCFSIGARPTGNKDPFGLRRSALGVLRILIEGGVDLDLRAFLATAARLQPELPADGEDAVVAEVEAFLMERLRGYYVASATGSPDGGGDAADGEPLAHSIFEAVLAVQPARPLDFDRRLRAVREFVKLEAAAALAAANKRISNILRQAGEETGEVDPALLSLPAEHALHASIEAVRGEVEAALDTGRYTDALTRLAGLRDAVDRFFDDVMVMDEDPALRRNRLALLGRLRELFTRTADISLLQHG